MKAWASTTEIHAPVGSPCFCTFEPSWAGAVSPSYLWPPSSAGRVHAQQPSQEGALLWGRLHRSFHSLISSHFCLYPDNVLWLVGHPPPHHPHEDVWPQEQETWRSVSISSAFPSERNWGFGSAESMKTDLKPGCIYFLSGFSHVCNILPIWNRVQAFAFGMTSKQTLNHSSTNLWCIFTGAWVTRRTHRPKFGCFWRGLHHWKGFGRLLSASKLG